MKQHQSERSAIYHVYPLAMVGAPEHRSPAEPVVNRISQLQGWIPYWKDLGIDTLLLGPVFDSMSHGYDGTDYYRIDPRLGSWDDMVHTAEALHESGIGLILDAVFNHVGRDFFAYQDLLTCGQTSAYRDWFKTDFCEGGVHCACWEGHEELIELNLECEELKQYLFGAVRRWIRDFRISGLRLDVAYTLDERFIRELRAVCDQEAGEFFLLGEMIHGDYTRLMRPQMLDSVTNYECYKGIYSSHNDRNYYEIAYGLDRQFGAQGIYRDQRLYNFVDNHDVDRLASALEDPRHLRASYILLFMMPGIPSIYYGSERGMTGKRSSTSDAALRPRMTAGSLSGDDQLYVLIRKLISLRKDLSAIRNGSYRQLAVANAHMAFSRLLGDQEIIVMLNLSDETVHMQLEQVEHQGFFQDMIGSEERVYIENGVSYIAVSPFGGRILVRA